MGDEVTYVISYHQDHSTPFSLCGPSKNPEVRAKDFAELSLALMEGFEYGRMYEIDFRPEAREALGETAVKVLEKIIEQQKDLYRRRSMMGD